MRREFANNIKEFVGLEPQAITTNATTAGEIIDTQKYPELTFVFSATITDGTYTPLLQEGDDSGLSDAADVIDANMTATEASAILSGDGTTKVSKLGVFGNTKRYIRASLVSASTSTGAICSVIAVAKPKVFPAV